MKRISGKTIVFAAVVLILSAICASCAQTGEKTVKIAVMGDADNFYPEYEAGIIKAIDDLNNEYSDTGFSFTYQIYDDSGRYEQGAEIIDALAEDKSVTAVVGSMDKDINSTAAYMFNERQKLFVIPYILYDSVYKNNKYETVFSLAASGKDMGACLMEAAKRETPAKRWAVCAAEDEFSISEMHGFMQKNDSRINVVDCNDIVTLISDFDNELKRWRLLGVEGIVFFPGEEYSYDVLFDMIKRIRERYPDVVCMGDSKFDNSKIIKSDPELAKSMEGFIIVNDFYEQRDNDDPKYMSFMTEYKEKHGRMFDLWYLQAYNMIRMIGDKAVEHDTNNGTRLAGILHDEGYEGISQKFVFAENGSQLFITTHYFVMNDDGTAKEKSQR